MFEHLRRLRDAIGWLPPVGRAGGPAEDPTDWLSLDYVHEQVAAQLEAQSEI